MILEFFLKRLQQKKEVKKFLGTVSYFRAFVKKFAKLAEPITRLSRNNVKFVWGESQICAFEKLKHEVVSAKSWHFQISIYTCVDVPLHTNFTPQK